MNFFIKKLKVFKISETHTFREFPEGSYPVINCQVFLHFRILYVTKRVKHQEKNCLEIRLYEFRPSGPALIKKSYKF